MNKEENKFLFKEKAYIEGKGIIQASKEIKELKFSQKEFRILYNENLRNKKEIERLNSEVKNPKQKNFKESFKSLFKKEEPKIYSGSLKNLSRIINFMEKEKRYPIKELCNELCMGNVELKGCLTWLNEYKVLKLEYPNVGGVIRHE
jgi:hypothetical protein